MLLSLGLPFLRSLIDFFKECYGVLNKPYETLRKIVVRKSIYPIILVGLLSWAYLFFNQVTRLGLHTSPLFLTYSLGKLAYAIAISYLVVGCSMYIVGRLVGGKGQILALLSAWSYSYVPTLVWFFITTIFYIILPPPRTESMAGQIFSIFYLFLSFGLILWKLIIYFLTMRFSLKLDIWQILKASIILWPFYVLFFLTLNRMGIFKIPFA